MPSEKTICVVLIFRNSTEERKRNLNFTINYYKRNLPQAPIILVEQDTDTHFENVNYHYVIDTNNDYFNRSLTINKGYNITQSEYCADYIIFGDADCLIEKDILDNIEDFYIYFDDYFVLPYSDKMYYLSENGTKIFIDNNKDNIGNNEKNNELEGMHTIVGGAGIISSENFYKVGGFDERFRGWGAEDDAFHNKCISLGLKIHRLRGELLHLNHSNSPKNYDNYGNNTKLYSEIFSQNNFKEYIHSLGFNHLEEPCVK